MITLAQTSTSTTPLSVGCSGSTLQAGAVARKLVPGGTVGAETISYTHAAASTTTVYAVFITDAGALDYNVWSAGTWTIRFKVSTANMNLVVDGAFVCRLNSAGTSQATIASSTGGATALGSNGVYTVTMSGVAQSITAGDRVGVYLLIRNTTTMTQAIGLTFDQIISTPILPPPLAQTSYRLRNDNGSETTATWKAALNTTSTIAQNERFRVRCEVQNTGTASVTTPFGWQVFAPTTVTQWAQRTDAPFVANETGDLPKFSPDSRWLVVNGTVYNTKAWDVEYEFATTVPRLSKSFSPTGTYLALADVSPAGVVVYNTSTWQAQTIQGSAAAWCCAFSPNGSYLAVCYLDSPYLRVLDTTTWTIISNVPTLVGVGRWCVFSPDSSRLYVVHDGTPFLTVLNTSNWSVVGSTPTLSGGGLSCDVSADGAYLAVTSGGSPYSRVYNTSNWTVVATPSITEGTYVCAFSTAGTYLAVGANPTRILETTSWSEVTTLVTTNTSASANWSANGYYLAVGQYVGTYLRLFNAATVAPDWFSLPAAGSTGVTARFANSSSVTDSQETTQQISSGSFVAGRVYESQHATTITIPASARTELEAVVELATAAISDYLRFRVVRDV